MSKYYNLKNLNSDEKFHFILESKIDKIDRILFNSYESDCGIGKENYNYIMRFINRQQKEIEEKNCLIDVLQHKIEELLDNKKEINYIKPIDIPVHNYINEDKIRDRLKELEEQKEKLKYDGNISFADYEQFCKNLKFFKEQIEELLEED